MSSVCISFKGLVCLSSLVPKRWCKRSPLVRLLMSRKTRLKMKNGGFTIPKMFKLDSPVCGSCHFDRASNEEFSVKFWMSVLILFSARIEIRSERIQFPQNCLIWVNPIVCVKSPIIPWRCHNFQNLASIKRDRPLLIPTVFFKYPLELKKKFS